MPSYNGVTFDIRTQEGKYPLAGPSAVIVRTKALGTDFEVVQNLGLTNPRWKVRAVLYSKADLATLQSSQNGVARTLSNYDGENLTNVYLSSVGQPTRGFMAEEIEVELEFEQTG
jgi:hypothetical protein